MNRTSAKVIIIMSLLLLAVSCSPIAGKYDKIKIPAGKKPGALYNPEYDFEVKIRGREDVYYLKSKKGKLDLPPGRYHISYIGIIKKDKKGNQWTLAGRIPRWFTLKPGQQMLLAFREPVKVRFAARGNHVSYTLTDQSGKDFVRVYKNGKEQPPFPVKILGPDGSVLEKGAFKYGSGGSVYYNLPVKKYEKGAKLAVETNLGAFGGKKTVKLSIGETELEKPSPSPSKKEEKKDGGKIKKVH